MFEVAEVLDNFLTGGKMTNIFFLSFSFIIKMVCPERKPTTTDTHMFMNLHHTILVYCKLYGISCFIHLLYFMYKIN